MRIWLIVTSIGLVLQGPQNDLRMKFIDDQTGFVIPPQTIQMNVANSSDPAAGEVRVASGARQPRIDVNVSGYRPMSVAIAPQDRQVEVRLVPSSPPPEFAADALRSLRAAGQLAVVGFVSDQGTGGPLPGVRVTAAGKVSDTNARGFFALTLPAPPGYSSDTGALVDITFSRPEYATLVRRNARVTTESTRKYRVSLHKGAGEEIVDEAANRRGQPADEPPPVAPAPAAAAAATAPPFLPATLRVGRNCPTSTGCTVVEVSALELYVKHVLPNEWIASWHPESLKAGSVAVRSVGTWFTAHPKSPNYDVCDTTACQVYDPTVSDEKTDLAVDETIKKVLVQQGTSTVMKAEYSAENNNAGCGDGSTGTGTTSPCIPDSVCRLQQRNGHGRGMCQKGSHRWARGTGADNHPAPGGPLNMSQILTHYYPSYVVVAGQ